MILHRTKPLDTTREMLSHIAWLSEELLRASEEKVNIAQAADDSVDRHVRILEQAINEQEYSITLGARPSHLAPSNLPDLVVPRWARPTRVTLSPMDGDETEIGDFTVYQENGGAPAIGIASGEENDRFYVQPTRGAGRRGRGRRRGRPPRVKPDATPGPLTITLPAHSGTAVANTQEDLYCYCQTGSWGEMIGCDGENCEHEWYHLKCVHLEATPQGSWYCPSCRPTGGRRKRK